MKRSKLLGSTSFQRKGVAPAVQKTIGEIIERGEVAFVWGPAGPSRKSEIINNLAEKLNRANSHPLSGVLDELPRADPEDEDAVRKMVEDRNQALREYRLPAGATIVAEGPRTPVAPMAPMTNRFIHIQTETTK